MSAELREAEEWEGREVSLPKPPVALAFIVSAYGPDCRVTVDGRVIERLRCFDLHSAYDEVTTVHIEGILSDGSEVSYSGRLMLDEPKGGD